MPPPPSQALLRELRAAISDERVLQRHRLRPAGALRARADCASTPTTTWPCRSVTSRRSPSRSWSRGCCALLALGPGDRVLDVGTGSGYHAALLAALGGRGVDDRALRPAGGGGHGEAARNWASPTSPAWWATARSGLPAHAPYDAINVAAGAAEVPGALERQLAVGGRLVVPVGGPNAVPCPRRGATAQTAGGASATRRCASCR